MSNFVIVTKSDGTFLDILSDEFGHEFTVINKTKVEEETLCLEFNEIQKDDQFVEAVFSNKK